MRVLVAIDSFKGSVSAGDVASAVAAGWRSVRPNDDLDLLPLADGGEGTAEAIARSVPGAVRHAAPGVCGPDGRPVTGEWFALPGGIAVLDLARMCGLPLMSRPDPMGATTRGLGQTIRRALDHGAREAWIGLGGSASTDAGLGALRALGLRAYDEAGVDVPDGGAGLAQVVAVDASRLAPIPGGVTLLTDVTSPLTGPHGAAAVFGPQKGATPEQVRELDEALARFAAVVGADPTVPGTGAAGGTAYGFSSAYGAGIVSGAERVAETTRLDERVATADLVVTGEGAFDSQSLEGKLVGNVLRRVAAAGTDCAVVAGEVRRDPGVPYVSLAALAGGADAAIADPWFWARRAGAALAHLVTREEG